MIITKIIAVKFQHFALDLKWDKIESINLKATDMRMISGTNRLLSFIFLFALVVTFLLTNPVGVSADTCSSFQFSHTGLPTSSDLCGTQTTYTVTVNSGSGKFLHGSGAPTYILAIAKTENAALIAVDKVLDTSQASSSNSVSFNFDTTAIDLSGNTKYYFKIYGEPVDQAELGEATGCSLTSVKTPAITADVYITQQRTVDGSSQTCYGYPSGCLEAGIPLQIAVEKVRECNQMYANKNVRVKVDGAGAGVVNSTDSSGNLPVITQTVSPSGLYTVIVEKTQGINKNIAKFSLNLNGAGACGNECMTTRPSQPGQGESLPYKICDQIDRTQGHLMEAYDACLECVGGSDTGTEGIWTAIGCIKRDPTAIVQNLLKVGLGMGGGVALLMILAAGFLFSISQGDPKRTGEAKELITAAITGLLFIIFSVVILQFIGYTVLQIPGFGG